MDPESEGRTSYAGWAFGPILLVLLYVSSVGPVAAITQKTSGPRGGVVIRQIYAPLIWLHQHTVLKKPLEVYVGFWGVH